MPILTKHDIIAAAYLGLIGFEKEPKIGATSVKVKIGQLMEAPSGKPLPLKDGYWLIEPQGFYLFEVKDECYLKSGFHGQIHSRSGWARYGLASRDADDDFSGGQAIWNQYKGKPLCTLKSLGTAVKVRPDDAIAQMHLAYDGFIPLRDEDDFWIIITNINI